MRRPVLLASLPVLASLSILVCPSVTPLHAQPTGHPPYMPTRDVVVAYDVQPEGAPSPQRITVSFSGGGQLMRVDSPDGQGDTILNRDKRLMTIVVNNAKVYMDIPERQELRSPFLLDASMNFIPAGSARIAGFDCSRWTISAPTGNATACVTADGVVLSEEGADSQGARGRLMAQSVTYAAIPASMFLPPAGYNRVAHPEGPAPYSRSQGGSQGGPMTGPANP